MRHINEIFPNYTIIQDDNFFKLSQDTVLLSDFASTFKSRRGLDLGAGVGCLGLLIMLKSDCAVDGVELTPGAAALAKENYSRCLVSQRGEIYNLDLRALPSSFAGKYDLCVSNPPYFDKARGKIAENPAMAAARCDQGCDIFALCASASKALRTGGKLCVCYKPNRMCELLSALSAAALVPKRLRFVHQTPQKPSILVMLEASKGGGAGLSILPPLFIQDSNGDKTAEYQAIYRRNI